MTSGDPTDTCCGSCLGRRTLLRGAAGVVGAAAGTGAVAAANAGGTWQTLGPVSQVPVRGGTVWPLFGQKWVVTQPRRGTFKGFSARCTHKGCWCNEVRQGTINCPCHGSKYDITTGVPVAGPAPRRLKRERVRIRNRNVQMFL